MKNHTIALFRAFVFVCLNLTFSSIFAQHNYRVASKEVLRLQESKEADVIESEGNLNMSIKFTPTSISIENHKMHQRIDYPINRVQENKSVGNITYFCDAYEVSLIRYADRLEIINLTHRVGKIYHFSTLEASVEEIFEKK